MLEKKIVVNGFRYKLLKIFRPVARGVKSTTPNLPKGPVLVTKWTKNEVFVGGMGGGVRFKSLLFGSKRSTFWGSCTSQKLILATGIKIFMKLKSKKF